MGDENSAGSEMVVSKGIYFIHPTIYLSTVFEYYVPGTGLTHRDTTESKTVTVFVFMEG